MCGHSVCNCGTILSVEIEGMVNEIAEMLLQSLDITKLPN